MSNTLILTNITFPFDSYHSFLDIPFRPLTLLKRLRMYTLTKFQKLMLINAHPSKLVLNTIGGAIALFYLWKHQPLFAILFGGIFIVAGTILTTKFYKFSPEKTADTFFGNIFLRYSTAFGFTFYLTSHILIPFSFWLNNLNLALLGLILLLCGLLKIK